MKWKKENKVLIWWEHVSGMGVKNGLTFQIKKNKNIFYCGHADAYINGNLHYTTSVLCL